jgi:hypothetical protein
VTDPLTTSRSARESLARGLNALQADSSVPPHLAELAAPIAQAMSALHQIERSSGLTPHADVALGHVRGALAQLQAQPPSHPAVAAALEAVAASLNLVHALSRMANGPAQPAPAPPQPAPAASPMAATAAAGQNPVFPSGAQPSFPQPQPQPHAQPQHAQPQPYAQPQPHAQPQPAPSPMVASDPFAGPPPAAAAPRPPTHGHHAYGGAPVAAEPRPATPSMPVPAPPAGNLPVVEAELGAHSPTNFYKGLAGNDIIDHGGLFVSTYKIPKLGTPVRLKVSLPGGYEFEANAVVKWAREQSGDAQPGFGAQITQITQEARQLIYRYVRNREPLFHDDF